MFINIEFGYKLNKYFSINCLSYPLMDQIIQNVIIETNKLLKKRDEEFKKILGQIEINLEILLKNKEEIQIKINEKNQNSDNLSKDKTKKSNKVNKNEPKDPLDEEFTNISDNIDQHTKNIDEYKNKLKLIKDDQEVYNSYLKEIKTNNYDLVDNTSTRKYINTKLEQRACEFLTEKKKYYLVKIEEQENTNEELKLLLLNAYTVRTVEDDINLKDEVQFSLNAPKKGNKKK